MTYYAAALGTPVLLGAAPLAGLAPDAPVHAFVRTAPRLDPALPLRPQLAQLIDTLQPVAHPGRLHQLRPRRVGHPPPAPLLRHDRHPRTGRARAARTAAAAPARTRRAHGPVAGAHPAAGQRRGLRRAIRGPAPGARQHGRVPHGGARGHPGAGPTLPGRRGVPARCGGRPAFRVPALLDHGGPGPAPALRSRRLRHRPRRVHGRTSDGTLLLLRTEPPTDADPVACASALHAWLASGKSLHEAVTQGLTVHTGGAVHQVRVIPG
ncbi:hypothetical protein ACRAWF_03740 [Streptomyces sp. L7]